MHIKIFSKKYFLVFGCILENTLKNPILSCFSHFLAFSQHPNKYIINSNKIQIHQNPNSQYPAKKFIKSEINPKSESKRIDDEIDLEEDRPRASRSAIRRDDLGSRSEEWVRRTSSTIWGMGSRSNDWVQRTSSTIWGMGSQSNDWGIAWRTSSVLGFLGSSELLDRSRLRRCWVLVRSLFRAVSLSLSLSLALSLFCTWPGNGLKVKWFCKMISESNEANFGQTEMVFRKFYFP